MKQAIFKYFSAFLIAFSPLFSSAYNNGDYGSVTTGAASWTTVASWTTWNGAAWVAAAAYPSNANTVYIRTGCTMTVNSVALCKCLNLTVEPGAQLYSNKNTSTAYNLFVSGTYVTDSGTIGNPGTTDDIVFSMEGANCTISGPGTFEAWQITKNTTVNSTNLTISMNTRLTCNKAAPTPDIYNNVGAAAAFNVTFSAGYTANLSSYAPTAGLGDLSINGTSGNSTFAYGIFTVNGTVNISGTLYLTSSNTTNPCSFIINDSVITTNVNANASSAPGYTLTMNDGGLLDIVGTPFVSIFSATHNTYGLQPGSTIEYGAAGVQNIDNNLFYQNLTLSGSGNKTASGALWIAGNLLINSPATLIPNAVTPSVNLYGNWTDYGTAGFTEAGSTVTFLGIANQTMTVPGGENFYNVIMDQGSGGHDLILDSTSGSEMLIANSLTLTSGLIIDDTSDAGSNIVFFGNGATVSGASNSSFVYGRVSVLGSSAFTFPVGKGAEYRPIAIGTASVTDTMTAQYFWQDPDNGVPVSYNTSLLNPPIDHVSVCEYWTLVSSANTTATVTLQWDTYSCGVTDPLSLVVTEDSTSTSNWNSLGNGGTTGTDVQGTIISSGAISFYSGQLSAYTLGSTTADPNNPLPVSLLYFNAKAEESNVLVSWTTASEINNDYFTIEKTVDGNNFVSVGEVKGAGSSTSEINYSLIDHAPFQGVSYYRLKQTDYDGKYSYSQLAVVNFTNELTSMITLFPNPTSDRTYINISWESMPKTNISEKTYTLHIFDINGREAMPQQVIKFSYGMLQSLDVSELPKGMYELQLVGNTDVQRTNLVKE